MASIPYMPLYVADYLADAAHLSTLEHGAYLLLIMNYWQRGKPLPASDERLTNVARTSNEEWRRVRPAVSEFFIDDGEFWHHKRIDEELAKFHEKSEKAKASRAAGLANVKRKSDDRSTNVKRSFNYTDTDTDTEEENTKQSTLARLLHDGFERIWNRYPVKDGRKAAERHFAASVKTEQDLTDINVALTKYLEHIKCNDWKRPKGGNTWFNNWRDWINWIEPIQGELNGTGNNQQNATAAGGGNGPRPYTPRQ